SPMAEIRPVVIKNNDPQRLADMLRQLFQERQRMNIPPGGQERPEDRVAITADPLTRTLLVASSKANYDEIVRLIAQLDVQPSAAGVIRTFFIRNADVSKAAQQLQNLFDRGIYRGTASTRDLPESLTRVTIIPDVRSSAIIVSASPENIAVVEDFLKQIDRAD